MNAPVKSLELLDDLCAFCLNHPELRFWQALHAWSGSAAIIYVRSIQEGSEDTYFWETRNGRKK